MLTVNPTWSPLLANLAVVALLITSWSYVHERITGRNCLLQRLAFGAVTGLGAAVVMYMPLQIHEGIFVDLRAACVGLAGFFGGPFAALVAAAIGLATRYAIGGAGMTGGMVGIAVVAAAGAIHHHLLAKREMQIADIFRFAAVATVCAFSGFAFLPPDMIVEALLAVMAPLATLVFAAATIAGLALHEERRRSRIVAMNTMFRAIIEALPDCLNAKDTEGRFIAANPATARLMKVDRVDDLIGRTDFDFYPENVAEAFRADELRFLAEGKTCLVEQTLPRPAEDPIWLATMKAPLRDATGTIVGIVTHNRDITDRKRMEADLTESRNRLADALAHMADGLVVFDSDNVLVYCNAQYPMLFPLTADLRVPGARLEAILRASVLRGEEIGVPADGVDAWVESIVRSTTVAGERQVQLFDGRWLEARTRPTRDGSKLVVFSDITGAKQAEGALRTLNAQLAKMANTDPLTGLGNRRVFDETLERECGRQTRSPEPLSLLLIDVDHFKKFNDIYGHQAGDRCLQAVARSLVGVATRVTDVPARYGGEEFAAVLPSTDETGASRIAEELRRAVLDLAIPHAGSEMGRVTVSIGVAVTETGDAEQGAMQLLRRADEALYAAKAAGRNAVIGFGDMPELGTSRTTLRQA